MSNLDNWVGNLYFELEKVNLVDVKVEPKTDKLFYAPVAGVTQAKVARIEDAIEEHQENKIEEARKNVSFAMDNTFSNQDDRKSFIGTQYGGGKVRSSAA